VEKDGSDTGVFLGTSHMRGKARGLPQDRMGQHYW
jgi:hypothetical protein